MTPHVALRSGLLREDDTPEFKSFCQQTYVVPPAHQRVCDIAVVAGDSRSRNLLSATQSSDNRTAPMKDIIRDYIGSCVRNYPNGFQPKAEQNVLALGYRSIVSVNHAYSFLYSIDCYLYTFDLLVDNSYQFMLPWHCIYSMQRKDSDVGMRNQCGIECFQGEIEIAHAVQVS